MRWEDLFADLDAQAAALETAQRAGEIDERTRIELAGLGLGDRLRAAAGAPLLVTAAGGVTVRGVLREVGPQWLLLDEGSGREALVVLAALVSVAGLGRSAATPGSGGALAARLTLRTALRGIARDRLPVRVHLTDGSAVDGTIDRVGGDFVDVARHAAGEARRRGEVRDVLVVPFAALVAVRRAASG